MPIIKEITGDIIQELKNGNIDVLVHGCNCFHTMGAGLAKQVAKQFPEARKIDIYVTKYGDTSKLGSYSVTPILKYKHGMIVNAYTQFYPGPYFKEEALLEVLKAMNETFEGLIIGFPQIGCGIGGGNWENVRKIIDENSSELKIVIIHYKEKINSKNLIKNTLKSFIN